MKRFMRKMFRQIFEKESKGLRVFIGTLESDCLELRRERSVLESDCLELREEAEKSKGLLRAKISVLRAKIQEDEITISDLKKNIRWFREQTIKYQNIVCKAADSFRELTDLDGEKFGTDAKASPAMKAILESVETYNGF